MLLEVGTIDRAAAHERRGAALTLLLAVGLGLAGGCSAEEGADRYGGPDTETIEDVGTDTDGAAGTDTDGDADSDSDVTDTDTSDDVSGDDVAWVSIPAGEFQMGCVPQDSACATDELPRHAVTIAAFQLTRTEVTQAQYAAVIGGNPSSNLPCDGSCPVEMVSWPEAGAFCAAIGGRLPTEAEWEYAARAGTTTIFTCGDDASCMDESAWYYGNSSGATRPVGQKAPNAFGLYDMLGNVWEWIADCWHDDYVDAPADGRAWEGKDCAERVLRGGQWCGSDVGYLRSSERFKTFPDDRHYYYGFRCARTTPLD